MKSKSFVRVLFVVLFFGVYKPAYSFEQANTHPALSQEAANLSQISTYLQSQLGYAAGLNTQLQITDTATPFVQDSIWRGMNPSITTRSILGWLREGSKLEDAKLYQARSQHHFHDSIRNTGLDNRTDYPDWEGAPTRLSPYFDLRGESALFWTITGTSSTGYPKNNLDTWNETRNRFYESLISSSASVREQCMAEMFLALGHILHMLEDMGVPAHTRNDFLFGHYRAFYDWGNPLESWVEEQIIANNGQSPWVGTGSVVFDKLAKYFDADEYSGGYLEGGLPPEGLWGLSECTNYQFLSLSTVFGCSGVKYQFPHPAKENAEPNLLEPAPGGKKVYFNGSNYGVTHLVRDSYTHYVATGFGYTSYPVIDSTITTDDVQVFEDYANITVPRTIDYATGLTNYFFRGRLSVEPNWADPNIVELFITNDSNNSGVPQVLKGGVFELYWDTTDGNRAEVNDFTVSGWGIESVLDYNAPVTATFTRQADAAAYTLVYQGQICQNPSEPDPCDPNALAVTVFRPGYAIIAWGRDDYGQVSDVPDGNEFIAVAAGKRHCLALRSDGSLVGWGYNNHGECNVPPGNDYVNISAGVWHSIALKSDGSITVWGDDSLNQITDKPDGNDFVAVAAGDYHSLALKSDGTIVGWGGWNSYGECDAPEPDAGTVYIDIAAGTYHSLALQSDGVVKAWGNNNQGQTRIYEAAAGKMHQAVAAGGNYSFLLRDDDVLISWGGGDWLEPGIPRYHYRQADGNDFTIIAAGTDHIMALTSDGKLFDWNWPYGNFPFDYFSRPVPLDVVFIEDVDAGYDFSVALRLP
jgi:hypothetical protein